MISLDGYKKIFKENLLIMSRTASGIIDVSASATKKDIMIVSDGNRAKEIVQNNIDNALDFLYDNRHREFSCEKELEDFILKLAQITNEGNVKSGSLFRSGADSTDFNYAKISDIPATWSWFIKTLQWLLESDSFEVYEIAAFIEIIINSRGHFFADGCGKISMLMALYVFMKQDLPGVKYLSRKEFYEMTDLVLSGIPTTPENLRHVFVDDGFLNFLNYYGSLCDGNSLSLYYKKEDTNTFVIGLKGIISHETFDKFKNYIQDFYNENKDASVVFECGHLVSICSAGAGYLADLKSSGKKFIFKNVGYECEISLFVEKLWDLVENPRAISRLQVSGNMTIGEGFNGKIYRINEEIIAKTFKKKSYYDDMKRERYLLRNALAHGVSAPFSFGYAIVDDGIALLMELLNSKAYVDVLLDDSQDYNRNMKNYVNLVKSLHENCSEENFKDFPVGTYEKSVLEKADIVDSLLEPKYRGVPRRIIENIDQPYGLIHGDIQPGNVMFSGEEMIFIDFDTFCVDKPIFDYASLYLNLIMDYAVGEMPINDINKLSFEKSKSFWEDFINLVYIDKSPEEKEKDLKVIRLIAAVRYAYLEKKRSSKNNPERLGKYVKFLEERIDDF